MQSSNETRSGVTRLAVMAAAWVTLTALAFAGPASPSRGMPAGQDPQAYAGEQVCLTCHEAQVKGYHDGLHGRAWNTRTPKAGRGCESCHGPGKAHADAGGDKSKIASFKTMKASEQSQVCTTCHVQKSHALWDGSQHEQRNISCTSCHSVHAAKGPSQLKARAETELCAACHRAVVNKQARFNHMPVREGKISCSSCHNVHGSQNVKLLRTGTTTDEACTSCHAEKRGPVLWEHAPVSESCTTCHDAHGSNNDRMLVAKQPFLCQRCHVTSRHPPTVYEGFLLKNSQNANKIYGRSCVACHQQIHGSNSPNGKAFLR